MRKEGFTLIELMIVVAIIAIIAAIAIPNLLTSKISANEGNAVSGLRTLVTQEALWYQGDVDRNGGKDYWTYDISCMHRMLRADNTTKVAFIDIAFAKADKLYAATQAALKAPELKAAFDREGAATVEMTSAEFTAYIKTEIDKWGRVVKEGNIHAQ